jgi:hypothetical protein
MACALPTEVPPNFITSVMIFSPICAGYAHGKRPFILNAA